MSKLETKSIVHLFKIRNDQERWQKYDQNSVSVRLFNEIPSLTIIERTKFQADLKTGNRNLKGALEGIGYEYSFNKNVLTSLIEEGAKDSEIPIIIACFQLVSLFYISNNDENNKKQISTDDFSLFMQILNFNYIQDIKDEINFLFHLLLESSLQTTNFEWTKDNIDLVFTQLNQNKSLPDSFFPIFCRFLNVIINSENSREYYSLIINFLVLSFKQKRELFENDKLFELINFIKPLIYELDPKSLYVLSEISKRIDFNLSQKTSAIPNQSLNEVMIQLVKLFDNKTAKSSEKFSISDNSQGSKIHDLPDTFQSDDINEYKFDYQFFNEKVFQKDSIINLPDEIATTEKFVLFKRFDSEFQNIVDIFATFIENCDSKWSASFVDKLTKSLIEIKNRGEIKYQLIAAYLLLLKKLVEDPQFKIDLSRCLPFLFDESETNPILFNSKNSVFGPLSLDPLLNEFRSAIIDLLILKNGQRKVNPKSKICFIKLLKVHSNQPFLFAETISRLICRIPIEELLDSSDINNDSSYHLISNNDNNEEQTSLLKDLLLMVSNNALSLKKLNAPIESRNAITTVIIEFLQNKVSFYSCLTIRQFVDCLFSFVFENGLSQLFLSAIYKALILIDKKDKIMPLDYIINLMYQCSQFIISLENKNEIDENSFIYKIKEKIYDIVSFSTRLCPRLAKLYDKFVVPILCDVSSVNTMNRAIYMLIIYSTKRYFVLEMSIFNLLVEKIKYMKYIHIINLIGMSTSLSSKSMFMIKRPCFLPLLFILFSNEENLKQQQQQNVRFREDAIELLKELATYSEYNRRALHDGKVDSILLSYINNENPIFVNGFQINLDYNDILLKKDALQLLNLIIPAKSSNEVVSHIINIITSSHQKSENEDFYDIFHELYKIVSKSINHPNPAFDIGNLRAFCRADFIDPIYFKETTFTISFMLKTDPLLLNRSTSQVLIVSLIENHSKRRFSIVLMNNGIYASYEANNTNTVVPLVQRSNPNEWAFYTFIFMFRKTQSGSNYIITSYKNLERQHDSEFCNIKFDNTPDLSLLLGSCSYSNRRIRNYFERCATVANLSIMPGAPKTREDIVDILLQNKKASIKYIFTTNYFSPKLTNRTEKMIFNNKELDVRFSKNRYENTTVETFLPNYCKKLINMFALTDQKALKYIIPLLSFSFKTLKSTKLINNFAAILMSDQIAVEKLDIVLYKSLFDIIFILYNNEKSIQASAKSSLSRKRNRSGSNVVDSFVITDCWCKSIVFNISIWRKSSEFPQILEFLSSSIGNYYIQNLFTNQPDFFCYFLKNLSQIIDEEKAENDEIIERFIFFISRVAYVQLEKEDCTKLFSLFSQIETKEKLAYYLKLIQNIAHPIQKCGFKGLKDFSTIYSKIETFSSSENEERDNTDQIHIVISLILALHELYGGEFHTKVVKIIKAISLSSSSFIKTLFNQLESLIDEYPNLFSLTTLIAFVYRIILNQGITKIPKKEKFSQTNLWFVFPSLLAIVNFSPTMLKHGQKEEEENDNIKLSKVLFDFITENSLIGNSIDSVTNFINVCSKKNVTQNPEIKLDKDGYLIDSPLYYYLDCLINKIFNDGIENKDVIFNVYFNSVAFLFFHLDVKLYPKERNDLDPMSYFELLYKTKSNFKESFKYHPCIDENIQLCNLDLFINIYQLGIKYSDLFGNSTEKVQDKSAKQMLINISMGIINGDNSKPLKNTFDVHEINNILDHFQKKNNKQEIQNYSPKDFELMNSIFEWMKGIISQSFRKDFDITCDLISGQLFNDISQKYPFIDKSIWIDYLKSSEITDISKSSNNFQQEETDSKFNLLPILNYCYCPFLCSNNYVDSKVDDEEMNNFFEGITTNNDENNNSNFIPNAFNIIYGSKVPIIFRIEQEGVYLNNHFVSYSYFKFVISMNRNSSSNKNNESDDLIDNSILFILVNGISFLLQFVENSSYFIQSIKKQKLPPSCFIAHSKEEMVELLKKICSGWQNSLYSTFDFLNVLNLIDGRTYLVCKPGSKQITNRHVPIFPSIDFLKSFSENPEQAKQLFSNPEIYYLIDEYPEAYENRKLLEKSNIIHEFVIIAFPDFFVNSNMPNQPNIGQFGPNIIIGPRKDFEVKKISVQKLDICSVLKANDLPIKFYKNLIFISKLNIPDENLIAPIILAFIFSNGPVIFGQVTFDKMDKLCFNQIVTRSISSKEISNDGKTFITHLSPKHDVFLKHIKTLIFAENEQGFIFHDMVTLRTITIKQFSSKPISTTEVSNVPATAANNSSNLSIQPKSSNSISRIASEPPRKNRVSNLNLSIPAPSDTDQSFLTSVSSVGISSSNFDMNSSSNFIQTQASSQKSQAKLSLTEDSCCFFEHFLFSHSVFLRNPSTVSTGSFGNLNENSIVDLVSPAADVTCIEQSRRFSIVGIGCDDGRVIVHAICPGVRICTVETFCKDEKVNYFPIPTKILFTDNCGLMLVYNSDSSLIVSTLNGKVLKRLKKFNTILSWFSFVPINEKVDFVGFVGSKLSGDNQKVYGNNYFLCCFEAMKPETVYCIAELPRNCEKFQIQFDKIKNAFIVASYRRDIMVIPLLDFQTNE